MRACLPLQLAPESYSLRVFVPKSLFYLICRMRMDEPRVRREIFLRQVVFGPKTTRNELRQLGLIAPYAEPEVFRVEVYYTAGSREGLETFLEITEALFIASAVSAVLAAFFVPFSVPYSVLPGFILALLFCIVIFQKIPLFKIYLFFLAPHEPLPTILCPLRRYERALAIRKVAPNIQKSYNKIAEPAFEPVTWYSGDQDRCGSETHRYIQRLVNALSRYSVRRALTSRPDNLSEYAFFPALHKSQLRCMRVFFCSSMSWPFF